MSADDESPLIYFSSPKKDTDEKKTSNETEKKASISSGFDPFRVFALDCKCHVTKLGSVLYREKISFNTYVSYSLHFCIAKQEAEMEC